LTISEVAESEAASFMRKHRLNFDTSEAMDDLAAAFERIARAAKADAFVEVWTILVQPQQWEFRARRVLALVTDYLTKPRGADPRC
jgi:hypothetical protein